MDNIMTCFVSFSMEDCLHSHLTSFWVTMWIEEDRELRLYACCMLSRLNIPIESTFSEEIISLLQLPEFMASTNNVKLGLLR